MALSPSNHTLYRHSKRPEWGMAIFAWERSGKRGFLFEDGKLRVFGHGYYELLEEIDVSPEEAAPVLDGLRRRLGWKRQEGTESVHRQFESISCDLQVDLFKELYPKGFSGASWARERRGMDAGRRLKRHRDVAILEATKLLSEDRLTGLVGVGEHAKVVESLREICASSDLIPKSQMLLLERLDDDGGRVLSESLIDFLYGEERLAIRFERFVTTLAKTTRSRPGWELSTVFPALVMPKEHMCIKPRDVRVQVARMAPGLVVPKVPSAPVYLRVLELVTTVRDSLIKKGFQPRDLLDIHDFMADTLSPKALKQMDAMMSSVRPPARGEPDSDKAA